jgi:CheY-like chemotaxis protein
VPTVSGIDSPRTLAQQIKSRRTGRGEPPLAVVLSREHRFGRLMRAVLSELGFDVRTDEEHAGAVERMARIKPELVILDIDLPRERLGWAMLEALREHPGTAGIAVVVCSAATWVLEQRELQLRREDVPTWTEPYSFADLVEAVRAALSQQSEQSPSA